MCIIFNKKERKKEMCFMLSICPIVVEQFSNIKQTSSKDNFNMTDFPSFVISFVIAHAAPANYLLISKCDFYVMYGWV